MAFRPNISALYYSQNSFTAYGEAQYNSAVPIMVNVIEFLDVAKASPIRSEASASHGRLDEETVVAKLLLAPNFPVRTNDRIDVFGKSLLVIGTYPRFDLFGRASHIEVTLRRLTVSDATANGSI